MIVRRIATSLLFLSALALTGAGGGAIASAAGAQPDRCYSAPAFDCGTLKVPIDHSDPAKGEFELKYLVQGRKAQRGKPVMVMLTGGPGQENLGWADIYTTGALAPLTDRYRLAVIDQRGTGQSGALNCPNIQDGDVSPGPVAECAEKLGPNRAFFDTGSSVQDIEKLRIALGQEKLALFGVSYGTVTAQQYARTFPEKTSALVLDGIASARGVDAFSIDKFGSVPRVLRELCAGGNCRGTTKDPVSDLAWLERRLAEGPIKGRTFNSRGKPVKITMESLDLFYPVIGGDMNRGLRGATPAALAATRRGNPSLLFRQLKALGLGDQSATNSARTYSMALFVATMCADQFLPYSLTGPFDLDSRIQATDQALRAIDPARYAPFSAEQVLYESPALMCIRWPRQRATPLSTAPLPDVPSLLLTGRLDVRTPVETADAVAAELPRSQSVKVPGTGHAVFAIDETNCVRRAVRLWVDGADATGACRGRSNRPKAEPLPPNSLRDLKAAPRTRPSIGRAITGAVASVNDALSFAQQSTWSFEPTRGGGLHGGWYAAISRNFRGPVRSELTLHRYQYVPGLKVSGKADGQPGGPVSGRLRIRARGVRGVLKLTRSGRVTGEVNGRAVRTQIAGRRGRGKSLRGSSANHPKAARKAMRLGGTLRGGR